MNKKLLGITAICLLGVGAAFASTTSTVYFTASGNLIKTEDQGLGIGYYVADVTNTGYPENDTNNYSLKIYNGEYVLDTSKSICTVTPISTSKVENKNSSTKSSSPYLYSEVSLSDLEFKRKGDGIVIHIAISAIDDNTNYSYTFSNVIDCEYKYNDVTKKNYQIGYSKLNVEGTYKDYFDVIISNKIDSIFLTNVSMTKRYLYNDSKGVFTYSKSSESLSLTTGSNGYASGVTSFYLALILKEDSSLSTSFSDGIKFSLPKFSKIS